MIEALKEMEQKYVDELNDSTKELFYAIMKIADEREEYKQRLDAIYDFIENHIKCNTEMNCEDMEGLKKYIKE